jgi:hypothetical protein
MPTISKLPDLSQECQADFERVQRFVIEVLQKDNMRTPPKMDLPNEVVGLKQHIETVEGILHTTQRLGIVGMGGIGKTTLTKALFESISGRFEYACFVDTVKLVMKKDMQLKDLRRIVIANLLYKGKTVNIHFDWKALTRKRVLIILDDADSDFQVNVMTANDKFSEDSRLIVTSRNRGFLIPLNFKFHMAEGLTIDDSKSYFACMLSRLGFHLSPMRNEWRTLHRSVAASLWLSRFVGDIYTVEKETHGMMRLENWVTRSL